jgi:hypothetical protein
MLERRAEPALDVGLHLAAETEHEAAPGPALEVPGRVGDVGRAPGEGDGDVAVEVEVGGARGPGQRDEDVLGALEREGTVESGGGEAGRGEGAVGVADEERGIELHGRHRGTSPAATMGAPVVTKWGGDPGPE